ncbi:hypothetical protein [Pseudoalteromonas sp. PPB1]|uniref:hypothetical protein n=1 Tax=Pseudoalteromonas sp. PPB1 TaxID=2756136 RepID=UPI001891DEDE|nr:hypothetical protein [Pseudoalteromonas sp. PPB1]
MQEKAALLNSHLLATHPLLVNFSSHVLSALFALLSVLFALLSALFDLQFVVFESLLLFIILPYIYVFIDLTKPTATDIKHKMNV